MGGNKMHHKDGNPLIDKLDSAVPRNAEYTRQFSKLVDLSMTPDWHRKVWRDGGHYLRRGDFREISGGELPVILHQYNRHDKRAGDKVELVETGTMSLLDMNSCVSQVYKVDPLENRVMRLDLASDVPDVPVDWFRNNTEFKGKQTNREWAVQSITQRTSQTLTSGIKPHQIRIYDKTGHRAKILSSEVRRMQRSEREFAMSFEDRWGYRPTRIVTRVERQIGGAEVAKFGYAKLGHLYELPKCDPFKQIIFPEDVQPDEELDELGIKDRIVAEWLMERSVREGIVNTKALVRRWSHNREAFHSFWRANRGFAMPTGARQMCTRNDLLESFRASIHVQLKQAA